MLKRKRTQDDPINTMGAKQSSSKTTSKSRKALNHSSAVIGRASGGVRRESPVARCPDSLTPSASNFNERACIAWFNQYHDKENPEIMGPDGIEQFLSDLDLSLESPIALVIAWKLQASTMGQFTQQEWITGMRGLGVDSTSKLKDKLPQLEHALSYPDQFKELYKFVFGFAKNQGQKNMSVETAIALWQLLLGDKYPHVHFFIQFLEEQAPIRVVNRDQWVSFLEFVATVDDNFAEWDETNAWPVLFDEYVEWRRKQQQQQTQPQKVENGMMA
ncbi:uncharacterized protein VTP21DRAFT_7359 [Calcarisporiella thermophila]|uniref:uncharacterized protein n=1 Tax=Calcarisporiella thermophila TaxID=911321 RepID=UPI0037421F53